MPGPSAVSDMVRIVEQRFAEPGLSLLVMQREIHLSRRHLGRLFIRYTGRTFHQYLGDVRIRAALSLLLEKSYGTKAVAAMVGYTSRSHFHRDFRARIGCPPTRFVSATGKWQNLALPLARNTAPGRPASDPTAPSRLG